MSDQDRDSRRSTARRSRSRHRGRSPSRDRSRSQRLRQQEELLVLERERLRYLEREISRKRDRLSAARSSKRREDGRERRLETPREQVDSSPRHEQRKRSPSRGSARRSKRPYSPHFSSKDVANLLSTIKATPPQPFTSAHTSNRGIDFKNILPEFNPSTKNQRIDVWLKKVNECAKVYGWDDITTVHFAMQKLQGLAKVWYESLESIMYTWSQWQAKLLSAFPFEQNYGQILEDMLKRKSRYNERIETYFYEKLALVNRCDISGKRAVDCIVHGISDKTMRSSAIAVRCTHPDNLLQFLLAHESGNEILNQERNNNFKPKTGSFDTARYTNRTNNQVSRNNNAVPLNCFNCREKGHTYQQCPKPLVKCSQCQRVGHTIQQCLNKSLRCTHCQRTGHLAEQCRAQESVNKTMSISTSSPSSKFLKDVIVNDVVVPAFIDFGSEVTILKESMVSRLGLEHDSVVSTMRGFGNELVQSLGSVAVDIVIDGVCAHVSCRIVPDRFLDVPLLVGQTYTEQSHVVVFKSAEKLQFHDVGTEMPLSKSEINESNVLKVVVEQPMVLNGAASIRAITLPRYNGYVLLDNKTVGKPNHQYTILGGVYSVKSGVISVCINPVSYPCLLYGGITISRATKVEVVNRVFSSSAEADTLSQVVLDNDSVKIGETACKADRNKLLDILKKYRHCFASTMKELGCTNAAEMNIEVNSKVPVVYRPYRLSHMEREKVRGMIGEMLEAGVIRDSVSEYASPIILVRKKDGKLRMCVDYRMLNSITVKERYPMPIIDDEITRLSGQGFFITLDLASGYYQVPIAEESKPLTAFVTPDGQYEFNRMPFGLANAPAVFQRMMNKVLGSDRFNKATAYIDDILIYGESVDECLAKLEAVLQSLENANLTLNLAKCEFLKDTVDYLGYEISASGIRPGSKKIQSVVDFPRPENQHTVRQFLGLVSYFRKFILNFAQIANPLNKLLKKNADWMWTKDQEESFSTLKDRLVERPVLTIYDPQAETELHTDASRIGIGGILLQRKHADDSFRPVAFYSRQTSPEEKNFHSYELETLAVICSLRKFRVYLLGLDFKVVTDCSALRTTFTKRDLIPRIARWWLLMQEFQCTIEYRPGTKMAHVDALSRNPVATHQSATEVDQYPMVMVLSDEDWLLTLQLGDSELCRIRDILTTDIDGDGLKYIKDNYLIRNNKLYKYIGGDTTNVRWVVPKGARWQLCRMNHDEIGHFGVEKTLDRIKGSYWFPKMSRFVKKYVSACIECAYAKKNSRATEGLLHPITKVEIPFHTVHIDHLGPFVKSKKGNSYLLVLIDAFTKFAFVKPVRTTKTQNALAVLEDIFNTFRTPNRIISDRGTCFTSHAFKRFCADRGIKHVLNAVASPQSNGQVERYNRTILSSLTAQNLNGDERDWDTKVGKIQWGLNNSVQKTTGRAPAEVMFGTCMSSEVDPRLNEVRQEMQGNVELSEIRQEVKDRIDAGQSKQKDYFNKGKRPARVYREGELVKITKISFNNDGRSKKLQPSYIGPYRVVTILDNDRYEVAPIPGLGGTKNKRKTTVAAARMLPWVHVAALELNNDSDSDDNKEDVSEKSGSEST